MLEYERKLVDIISNHSIAINNNNETMKELRNLNEKKNSKIIELTSIINGAVSNISPAKDIFQDVHKNILTSQAIPLSDKQSILDKLNAVSTIMDNVSFILKKYEVKK